MPAGCLGNRTKLVTIEQLSTTTEPGFPKETWTTLRTAYMERLDATGREAFKAGMISASVDSVWKTEYSGDMDPEAVNVPKMRRLVYQGRIYDITKGTIDPTYPVKRYIVLGTLAKAG